MSEKMNELYDDYRAGRVDRREFMKKLALVTGGTAAAVVSFPGCRTALMLRRLRMMSLNSSMSSLPTPERPVRCAHISLCRKERRNCRQ